MNTSVTTETDGRKTYLLALALGTFALGIAEFTMMGIISNVADDLQISVPKAGHLISAYALGVAVGSPGLIFLRKLPLRSLMLLLAGIIAIGNALVAISPNFITMLCARFISGLPHGAFFGVGAIVCTKLSPGKGASAVAGMVGGMAVANVVGVPGATFITNALSWRPAFGIVAVCGLLAFISIRMLLPRMEALPDTGLRGQFHFLRSSAPWLIYGGVFFGQASVYCWFSYLEPLMTQVTGFTAANMTWIMVLAGTGMLLGNIFAGKMADTHHPSLVSGWITASVVLFMLLTYVCIHWKVPTAILMVFNTACLFGLGGPPQFMIVRFAKGGEMLGGAGIQISFNVANAMAASIGGALISAGMGWEAPALAGIPLAIIGASCFFVLYKRFWGKGA